MGLSRTGLSRLIFDGGTVLEDHENMTDIMYVDFRKALDRFFHYVLVDTMVKCGLEGTAFWCVQSWLNNHSQGAIPPSL